jgi:hypothetical protein
MGMVSVGMAGMTMGHKRVVVPNWRPNLRMFLAPTVELEPLTEHFGGDVDQFHVEQVARGSTLLLWLLGAGTSNRSEGPSRRWMAPARAHGQVSDVVTPKGDDGWRRPR